MERPYYLQAITVEYIDKHKYVVYYELKNSSVFSLRVNTWIGAVEKMSLFLPVITNLMASTLHEYTTVLNYIYEDVEVLERLFSKDNYQENIDRYVKDLARIG